MKITELMQALQAIKKTHGNLPVVGSTMNDQSQLKKVVVIDEHGRNVINSKCKAHGIFFEA